MQHFTKGVSSNAAAADLKNTSAHFLQAIDPLFVWE
jgi:hypothetical protein